MSELKHDIAAALGLLQRACTDIRDRLTRQPAWAAWCQLEARETAEQPLTAVDATSLRQQLEGRLDAIAAEWRLLPGIEAAIRSLEGMPTMDAVAPSTAPAIAPASGAANDSPSGSLRAALAAMPASVEPAEPPQPPVPANPRAELNRIRKAAEADEAASTDRPARPPAPDSAAADKADNAEPRASRGIADGSWPVLPEGLRRHHPFAIAASAAAPAAAAPVVVPPAGDAGIATDFDDGTAGRTAGIEAEIDHMRDRQPAPTMPAGMVHPSQQPLTAGPEAAADVEEAEVEIVSSADSRRTGTAPPERRWPRDREKRPPATPWLLRRTAVPTDADLADIVDEASVEIVRREKPASDPAKSSG